MDANAITTLIGTVGFPIVAYFFMWKYMLEINKAHKEEIDGLKEVINQNTLVLTELRDTINNIKGGKENGTT